MFPRDYGDSQERYDKVNVKKVKITKLTNNYWALVQFQDDFHLKGYYFQHYNDGPNGLVLIKMLLLENLFGPLWI